MSYWILQLFTAFGHFVRFFGTYVALFEHMMVYSTDYVIFVYACLMLFQVISASVSFYCDYHTMDRSRPFAAVTTVVIRHRLVGIPFVSTVMALAIPPMIVLNPCTVVSVRVVSILPNRVRFLATGRYPLVRPMLWISKKTWQCHMVVLKILLLSIWKAILHIPLLFVGELLTLSQCWLKTVYKIIHLKN